MMAARLKKSLLYAYGAADLSFTLMMNMEVYFFSAFLTDHAKFPLLLAGQIMVYAGLIDLACSLLGGIILQKTNLNFGGKYRSWFLIAPPIIAPLFILQFTKIGSNWTAASIIILGFISSHLLFNVVVSASGAMVGKLSQESDERTILSASRAQGMAMAGLIFSGAAMPMIAFFTKHADRVAGFTMTTAVFTILMVLGYWLIYKMTAGHDAYDGMAPKSPQSSGQSIAKIFGLVFKNPPLLFLILASIFSYTGFFIITTLAFYYFTYVAGNPKLLSVFILFVSVARLAGTLTAAWIGVRIGKRKAYWLCLILGAVGFACAKLLQHSPWGFIYVFSIAIVLVSIASAMITALFSDTAVYGEWRTGRDIRAFTMALMNLPIKVGVLIRAGIPAGLMMIGFAADTAPAPRVVEGISFFMTLLSGAAYAIAAGIFYFGYRIEDKQVLQMQEEIAARKIAICD
jgi:Na+/melibiose symporter-like transporter